MMQARYSRPPRARARGLLAAAVALAALIQPAVTQAQLGDMLKGGSSAAGELGGLSSGLSLQSLSSGSLGNVAGVLEYCIKNNYLSGGTTGAASTVKDKLVGQLGGAGAATSDAGYKSGPSGILQSSDGKSVDLTGSGLKAQMTQQVCDKILTQAKSML